VIVMKKMTLAIVGLCALAIGLGGCAAKKQDQTAHFGTQANWPVFHGAKDFFHRQGQVNEVLFRHRLSGKPVDMGWISPAFREQLCLTLTINNHCVG
jgi:hypothetical protein